MTPPRWRKSSRAFFLIGLFCLTAAFSLKAYQRHQENILSFSESPPLIEVVTEGNLPARILIPKVRIDLPVFPVKMVEDQWATPAEGVAYLLGSGIPGRPGNAVIYGHNKNHLFDPIRWLEKGEAVNLINKKGEEFVYQVVETKKVSPEAVEVLSPTRDATLTLYTCAGFLDKERFVVVAKLQPELK